MDYFYGKISVTIQVDEPDTEGYEIIIPIEPGNDNSSNMYGESDYGDDNITDSGDSLYDAVDVKQCSYSMNIKQTTEGKNEH